MLLVCLYVKSKMTSNQHELDPLRDPVVIQKVFLEYNINISSQVNIELSCFQRGIS